jgi:membrane-associated protease RseP (regulator of RpoE activity)
MAALTIIIAVITYMHPMFDSLGVLKPYFSILVGAFGIPALLISLLFQHALEIIVEQSPIPGVSPLLPGITEEGLVFFFPGTGIQIEFWSALIAIICLLVPHEFAHGVLTRCQKIKLKSAGILTAGPIPVGAFVEPDNKEMERHEGRERMRIYAVGSFTNLIVSIIAVLLFIAMVPVSSSVTEPTYMEITNVVDGSPADGILQEGFIIKEVNGIETIDTESFTRAISQLKPNQRITIVTVNNGALDLITGANPKNSSVGYIGIDLKQEYKIKDEFQENALSVFYAESIFFITPTLFWIFFLSFNIALVNLLPVVPFDGGKMFEEIMREFGIRIRKEEIII